MPVMVSNKICFAMGKRVRAGDVHCRQLSVVSNFGRYFGNQSNLVYFPEKTHKSEGEKVGMLPMIEYKNILGVDASIQEKVRRWRNSPRVRRGMLDQTEITAEQHTNWLRSLAEKREINIVRVALADDVPFGVINLRDIDRSAQTCDWGIYIGEDTFLGRGLGKRLAYDVREWGFVDEGLNKMYSTVRADNLKALHSYLELGDHVEGFLKDHICDPEGNRIGIYLVAQFREDWLRNRERVAERGKIDD